MVFFLLFATDFKTLDVSINVQVQDRTYVEM
jgi:hypothetical protein